MMNEDQIKICADASVGHRKNCKESAADGLADYLDECPELVLAYCQLALSSLAEDFFSQHQ